MLRDAAPLLAVAFVCSTIEAALWLADMGWIGSTRWRTAALAYTAFWPGLLHGWVPNYPGQSVAMFFTYSWLHSGPSHLLGNMAVLVWIGLMVVERLGRAGFLLAWTLSALGGAAIFGLLSTSPSPMVGASGALFGLMGVMVALNYRADRNLGRALLMSGGLVVLNMVTLVLQGGVLAWQTHLGGYLTGLAMIALFGDRLTARRDHKNATYIQ